MVRVGQKRPHLEPVFEPSSTDVNNITFDESNDNYRTRDYHLPTRATRRRIQDPNDTRYQRDEAQPRNFLQEIINSRLSDGPQDVPRTIYQVPDDQGRSLNGLHSSETSFTPHHQYPRSDPPTPFVGGSFRPAGSVAQWASDWTPRQDDSYPFSSRGDPYDQPTAPTVPTVPHYQPYPVQPSHPSPYVSMSPDIQRPAAIPRPEIPRPETFPSHDYLHQYDHVQTPTVWQDQPPHLVTGIHPMATSRHLPSGFDLGVQQDTFDGFDYNSIQNHHQSEFNTDFASPTAQVINTVGSIQNGGNGIGYFQNAHEATSVRHNYDDTRPHHLSNPNRIDRTYEEPRQLGRPEESEERQGHENNMTPDEIIYPRETLFRQMSDITSVSSHRGMAVDNSQQQANDWPGSWNNEEGSNRMGGGTGLPHTTQQYPTMTNNGMNENSMFEEDGLGGQFDFNDYRSPIPPPYGQEHHQLATSVGLHVFDHNNAEQDELDRNVMNQQNTLPIPRALFASPETRVDVDGQRNHYQGQRINEGQQQSIEWASSGERDFWDYF